MFDGLERVKIWLQFAQANGVDHLIKGIAMTTQTTISRIIRLSTVLYMTGLSRSTLYRKMAAGTFPKNIRLSERCAGWYESDVDQWVRNPMHYSAGQDVRSGDLPVSDVIRTGGLATPFSTRAMALVMWCSIPLKLSPVRDAISL